MIVANLAYQAQTSHPQCVIEVIQRLIEKRGSSRQSQWTRSSEMREDMYLVYHVDKCLNSIPAKTSDYLDLTPVRENGRNQGDPFICGEGTPNQAFPVWTVDVCVNGWIMEAERLRTRWIRDVRSRLLAGG